MRNIGWLAATCALAMAGSVQAAPLEAYGRLPMIEEAELSPDGQQIALALTDGEQRLVAVRTIASNTPTTIIRAGDLKLRSIQWAGSTHLLLTVSTTTAMLDVIAPRAEWWVTQDYDLRQRHTSSLFRGLPSEQGLNVTAIGPWVLPGQASPTVVLGGIAFVEGQGELTLFRTALDGSRTLIVASGNRDTRDWVVDESGQPIAALDVRGETGAWSIRLHNGGSWRTIAAPADFTRAPSLLGLGRDGRSVVVRTEEGDATHLRELSIDTGAWSDPLDGAAETQAEFDRRTGRLNALVTETGDDTEYHFFDPADQARWNGMVHAFPGQRVSNVTFSDDRSRALALVDSPSEGPAYALVDFTTGHATWIGAEYRGIGEADISPVSYITYHAADGLEIGAYLTLPRGRDPRHLPLVVLPHGGPESRDEGGFDWWAQALASRGYAVLQPNFRGSAGYGVAFVRAGYGQWGRKMQTDLSDGVTFLAHQGTVDAARVCIVGASYGGYAALAGVTLQHGVYRCAASVGGVSNPGGLINYDEGQGDSGARRYWNEFMGITGPRDPHLVEISPLAQAAHADAPILLVHGRDDTVVPFSQSSSMQAALQRANHPVQLVDLGNEDHWLSRGATRLQMLTEVVRFLEANNPPDTPPAAVSAQPH